MAEIVNGKMKLDSSAQQLDDTVFIAQALSQMGWGLSLQRQDFWYRVIDNKVYLDVWVIDANGDKATNQQWMHNIGGQVLTLDCENGLGLYGKYGAGGTGAARIELPQGVLGSPVESYIYVVYDEQLQKLVLALSENEPFGAVGLVAHVSIEDYQHVADHAPLVLQRTTQTLEHGLQGIIAWILSKSRAETSYDYGVDTEFIITANASALDTIELNTSNGQVRQANPQSVQPIFSATDTVHVHNVQVGGDIPVNNTRISNLGALLQDSQNNVIADGQYATFIFWGSVNHGGASHLCVNLPDGFYNNEADAIADADNLAHRAYPQYASKTGFLICRAVLRFNTANGGTWSNVLSKPVKNVITKSTYLSSPSFPYYVNNVDTLVDTISIPSATRIRVHFMSFDTEDNYDYVYLKNTNASQVHTYHGRNKGKFTSKWIDGDTMKIYFKSDGSVTRKGYEIDYYEYETTSQVGGELRDLRGTLGNN